MEKLTLVIKKSKMSDIINLMKKKTLLIISAIVAVMIASFFFLGMRNNSLGDDPAMASLVDCLADRGVLVYGSRTCPACLEFANQFGGYDIIAPIYVECANEKEKCYQEMQTRYVPEIQINGELYEGPRTPEILARFVGCEI